ncbi:hypothetical protein M493_15020 [Geobacillus genomosp. 3]|uniref:Uncharacterized protein n=1 Tax=Geobacillus genomosp. 3 TaxID=1921421 RepID=S6A3N2_GEOG3|nr:hypothetical protein M493_15020 [Geobacillus genomosp. 3]
MIQLRHREVDLPRFFLFHLVYYLEDRLSMKMKLSDLIKLFGEMKNESDPSKYDEYIERFDAISNEIQNFILKSR